MQRAMIQLTSDEVKKVCINEVMSYMSYGRNAYHMKATLSPTGECSVECVPKTPEEIRIAEAQKAGQ